MNRRLSRHVLSEQILSFALPADVVLIRASLKPVEFLQKLLDAIGVHRAEVSTNPSAFPDNERRGQSAQSNAASAGSESSTSARPSSRHLVSRADSQLSLIKFDR